MKLDEMLALLPDNDTGEISPADLRAIVTDLYQSANSVTSAYVYRWATNGTAPSGGHVTMDQPWQLFATKALVSETADDGQVPGFGLIDNAVAARVWITTAAGAKFTADVTGPSVDVGTYREVPIAPVEAVGDQPTNNTLVTLSLIVVGS